MAGGFLWKVFDIPLKLSQKQQVLVAYVSNVSVVTLHYRDVFLHP